MLALKTFYSNPRPYWSSENIKAWSCSSDFGNPSGHSMLSMTFSVTHGLSIYDESQNKNIFVLIFGVIAALLVGYARLVLGAHSLNQIFFGWQLGLWIAISISYFKEKIIKHISTAN